MDYDSNSGDNSGGDSAPEFSDDNEKTLCTCGCKERLSVRQKNRHLKKARERARKDLPNLDEPELMDVDAGLQGDFAGAQEVNNWEERVGDDLFDHANDLDRKLVRGWHTAPNTTPPPPDLSDDEVPSDEDGYHHVTAEDYREYDRWYAEDRQDEWDEMVAETLTEKEMSEFIGRLAPSGTAVKS